LTSYYNSYSDQPNSCILWYYRDLFQHTHMLMLHAYFMSDGSDSSDGKTPTDEHTTYKQQVLLLFECCYGTL